MKKWAYYNEIDPYAAQWIRNLMKAGHVAPGFVDERSIQDVRPDDVFEFSQCHWFAGIAGWSRALRLAGVSDDTRVWTGSCPCQPFSSAGAGVGFADERHLWPAWFHLISQCNPPKIYGEQVASPDALKWFDLVQPDLEAAGYAVGVADICAAGIGAPHIRQRLWFVADAQCERNFQQHGDSVQRGRSDDAEQIGLGGSAHGMADSKQFQREGRDSEHGIVSLSKGRGAAAELAGLGGAIALAHRNSQRCNCGNENGSAEARPSAGDASCRCAGVMGNTISPRLEGHTGNVYGAPGRSQPVRPTAETGGSNRLADTESGRLGIMRSAPGSAGQHDISGETDRPSPLNGFWRDADWLYCRDGKWRPVIASHVGVADGLPDDLVSSCTEEHAEESDEVNGTPSQTDAAEALPAVPKADDPESLRRLPGGLDELHEAVVLRPGLHGASDEQGTVPELEPQPHEGTPASKVSVRGMRGNGQAARSPQRRGPFQQRPIQLADVVPHLSSSIALAELHGRRRDAEALYALCESICKEQALPHTPEQATEIWRSLSQEDQDRIGLDFGRVWVAREFSPLSQGESARVGRLRAYGNAIVPPLAAIFIQACGGVN